MALYMNRMNFLCFVLWSCLLYVKYTKGQSAEDLLRDSQNPERYPFMVSIRNFGRFDCGGALIDAHTVITAAQCVDERYGRDRLPYMWLTATDTNVLTNTTVPRRAIEVRLHPNYTGDIFDGNDFALLKLNETAAPLYPVFPVDPQYDRADLGMELSFLGFGRSTRSSSRSPYLQITHCNVIDPVACQNSEDIVFLDDKMICLEGDTPCSGDQGGPLILDRGAPYGNLLFGIISQVVCDLNSRLIAVPSLLDPDTAKWIIETQEEFNNGTNNIDEDLDQYFLQEIESPEPSVSSDEDIEWFLNF
eukprot:g4030.t1